MKALRDLLQPPRPWHLLLAPAVPLLALLKGSVAMTPATVIVAPLLVSVAFAIVLCVALAPLAADRHRAAFAVTTVTLACLSYMKIALGAERLGMASAVWVMYAGVLLAVVLMLRSPRPAAAITTFANRAFAIAVLFLTVPVVWTEWQRPRTTASLLDIPEVQAAERPDVYVIVLDGYGREDVLRDVYGFENTLVRDLRSLGFLVADEAAANYSHTALSLASALNTEYLPALNHPAREDVDTRRGLADLISDSRFFNAFADAGYRIRTYSSEYSLLHPRQADERPSPLAYLDEFAYAAYEGTIFPSMFQAVGLSRAWLPLKLHRRHIVWTLDHLAESTLDDSRPALVFAHILAPHPPFAFSADGGQRETRMPALFVDADMWHSIARGTGESYKSGYLDTVRVLNARIVKAVQHVLASRRRPSIVLIHSDHGPGSRMKWNDPAATDVRERLGILLATRFPNGEKPPLGSAPTPINVYRAILNRALGTSLGALEDRSFFSTWRQPFAYIEVTEKLGTTPN